VKTPPRKEGEYWENACYPWVSIADMIDGEIIKKTKEQVNQYSSDTVFKEKISPAGALLMSFKLTVGKVSILGMDAFHNEAIICPRRQDRPDRYEVGQPLCPEHGRFPDHHPAAEEKRHRGLFRERKHLDI